MAVAFDAKTAAYTSVTAGTTISMTNLTVGAGANRGLILCLQCGSQGASFPAALSLVWDSVGANQTLTQISGTLVANGVLTEVAALYGLVAPASGNKTLTISWTGNNEMHASAAAFTGVDQTSVAVAFPHGTTVAHTTSTASPTSVTITSASGNMVVACHSQNVSPWGVISGTQLAKDDVTGPNIGVVSNYNNGAATVTMTAAFTGTAAWDAIGCDVLAAGGVAAIAAKKIIRNRQALVRAAHW
jgi:hypothetical protein